MKYVYDNNRVSILKLNSKYIKAKRYSWLEESLLASSVEYLEAAFNREQLKALAFNAKNILVSASAGTGKTKVLIDRIGRYLLSDRIEVSNILALTFTENAASEIKKRMENYLKSQIKKNPDREEELNRHIAKLPNSDISTFHSFCLKVVRKYYPIIGLKAKQALNIIDEGVAATLKEEALEKVFSQYQNDAVFQDLVYITASNAVDQSAIKDIVIRISDSIKQAEDSDKYIEFILKQYDADYKLSSAMDKIFVEYLEHWKMKVVGYLTYIVENFSLVEAKRYKDNHVFFKHRLEMIKVLDPNGGLKEIWRTIENFLSIKNCNLGGKDLDEDLAKAYNKLVGYTKEILEWFYPLETTLNDLKAIQEYVVKLIEIVKRYQAEYDLLKSDQGLDFDDMEEYCLKILQAGDKEIAKELKKQYHYIYIDEFQDTSFIQDQIIKLIERDSNVFRVGDIKQSIYGFRNAKPQLFLNYQKAKNQSVIRLVRNYRSSSKILNFVNELFLELFNIEGLEKIYTVDDKVIFSKGEKNDCKDLPEVIFISERPKEETVVFDEDYSNVEIDYEGIASDDSEDDGDQQVLSNDQKKAIYIADKIISLKEKGVALKDIVILMRSGTNGATISEVFKQKDIKIKIGVKGSFTKSPKIMAMISAFKLANNNDDEIALISVLKNYFNYDEKTFASWRLDNRDTWWKLLESNAADDFKKLRDMLNISKSMSLVELFEFWYQQPNFIYTNLTMVERNNLFVLREMISKFESDNMLSLNAFLERFDYLAKNANDKEVVIFGADEDAVLVETIHGSKGKEYPYVFLWGANKINDAEYYKTIFVHSDYGLSFRMVDNTQRFKRNNIVSFLTKKQVIKQTRMEELRVFYVALTRAEKQFYYVDACTYKPDEKRDLDYEELLKSKSYTNWLMCLLNQPKWQEFVNFDVTEVNELSKVETDNEQNPGFDYQLPVLSFKEAPSKHQPRFEWEANIGMAKGSDVHKMIERHLKGLAPITDKRIERLFNNEQFKDWLNYDYVSEYSYYSLVDQQINKGVIDFIAFKDEEIIIVDFKSDRVNSDQELIDLYKPQIENYCDIIKKEYEKPVKGYIYSLNLNLMIEVKL